MKERSKILIVDDRPENIFSLKQLLLETDAEVISASNGNEALTATLNHDFAVALLDVQMPEMDGYELAEFFRSEEKTRQLPIIFVSAVYMSIEHVFKGYDSGAVDFLVKPFDAKILLSKIRVFLELHNQKRKLEQSEKMIRDQYDELQASERRFETLVNTVPDIVYRIDPEGNFTFVNDAIEKLGYNPKELIGTHFSKLILPLDLAAVSRKDVLSESSGDSREKSVRLFDERRTGKRKTTGLEIRLIPKSGTRDVMGILENLDEDSTIVEVNSSGFYSDRVEKDEKVFLGTVGVIRDITDRKKLEDGLKKAKEDLETKIAERTLELTEKNRALTLEEEKRKKAETETLRAKQEWEDIFNAIGHMAMVMDNDHRILAVNRSTVEHSGRPAEELVGRVCHEIFHHSGTQAAQCPALNMCETAVTSVGEVKFDPLDKSFIVSCTPIYDQNGELQKIIHIMTDISERKRLEKQLIQAHKMEAIGTLAGGVAHDFNNILTSLLGYTQIMLSETEKGSMIEQEDLQEVYRAGLRAKELVRQILTFARKTEDEMMPVRIDLIVKEVLKFIRSSIPTSISIRENVTSRSKVIANATQIHQVIMNLCTNASHAMDEQGGILTIDLTDKRLDECRYVSGQKVVPGDYIMLAVTDTGSGISPDIMERIFEPYFTTKSVEEGTGMGLALVQSIINEAGGVIQVKSEVHSGSRFEILLPVTEKEKRPEKKYSEPLKAGKGRILFIDDEIPITGLFKKVLEGHGYDVTVFNNPRQALTAFETNPEKFDVVISDLTMPDIKGDKLIEQIHAIRRDIPCILCTGYSKELTKKSDSIQGLKAILIKPIDRANLLFTIQQVLSGETVQSE